MDPEEKAKQALALAITRVNPQGLLHISRDALIAELRNQGFRIAPITQWGKDPSGRW